MEGEGLMFEHAPWGYVVISCSSAMTTMDRAEARLQNFTIYAAFIIPFDWLSGGSDD